MVAIVTFNSCAAARLKEEAALLGARHMSPWAGRLTLLAKLIAKVSKIQPLVG